MAFSNQNRAGAQESRPAVHNLNWSVAERSRGAGLALGDGGCRVLEHYSLGSVRVRAAREPTVRDDRRGYAAGHHLRTDALLGISGKLLLKKLCLAIGTVGEATGGFSELNVSICAHCFGVVESNS